MSTNGTRLQLPPPYRSLSARLLVLTIAFVMLGEVLIYAPSAARFRYEFLQERLATAHVAVLALLATPNNMVSDSLQAELLQRASAYAIALRRPDGVKLLMRSKQGVPVVDASYDLGQRNLLGLIGDVFMTLSHPANRVLRIVGPSPKTLDSLVETVIDEAPMRAALIAYSARVLGLSVIISLVAAALVYLSLQWMMIRPMRRLTAAMVAFRDDPEDSARSLKPSRRRDEIGVAERELVAMQAGLRAALGQKARLAALGGAVTRINHDLRNILTTASIVTDRLASSEDPQVRRNARALVAAIDRAAQLCTATLDFTREGPPNLTLSSFSLAELIGEVGLALQAPEGAQGPVRCAVPESLAVEADRSQLFRILANLAQNAAQAGATRIEISARREPAVVRIRVADDGSGLTSRARENLFQPFAGSTRPGGTGLGLAIVRELVRAHGGEIRLESSGAQGTVFVIELPQNAAP
ncbi:MAG TPA: HAMP domain-containing sensor histidine kinase [Candidatus Udaeobacter sp.]|nr:HAMP domain-containing sensor histidine kinase [Candidatus Udaeobacter sp.]